MTDLTTDDHRGGTAVKEEGHSPPLLTTAAETGDFEGFDDDQEGALLYMHAFQIGPAFNFDVLYLGTPCIPLKVDSSPTPQLPNSLTYM